MSDESNEFKDFVAYLDDADQKREVWCNVIDVNFFCIFKLRSGKQISIPNHRVLKIKQEGQQ